MKHVTSVVILGLSLALSGCFWQQQRGEQTDLPPRPADGPMDETVPADVADIPDAMPRDEPLSQYGNPESYTVYGETYQVLPSARGYAERGYASWYGRKFHGRRTSSGEIYDMYQMTAAHRTLPLPSYVRIRNLDNNREITVRVNDRGPFHSDRIIDLSYAAAAKLGILDAGSAMVQVEAIDPSRTIAQAPPQAAAQEQGYPQSAPPAGTPGPQTGGYNSGYPDSGDGYSDPYAQNSYPQGPSVTGGGFDDGAPQATPMPAPAAPPTPPVSPPAPPAPSAGSIYGDNSYGSAEPEVPAPAEPSSVYDTPVSIYDTPNTNYNEQQAGYGGQQYEAPGDYQQPPQTAYATPYESRSMAPGTYLQAGAYAQSSNAQAMVDRLSNAGFKNVTISNDRGDGLSRVHVGPYQDGIGLQEDKRRLNVMGISAFTVRR